MNRFLSTVLAVAVAIPVGCSKNDHPDSAQSLAARAVELLSRGEPRGVAVMMHYPPTYTPEEKKRDLSSTGDGIDLTAREFGEISNLKAHMGSALFYEVGGTGGNVAYGSSLSPHHSEQFLYEAEFSRLGNGYIRITVIQLAPESPFEILGVYFGLPAADPRSKPAIVEITRKQLIHMQVPVTPDVERQIEEALRPVQYPT